jgi:hypothetical protein
MISAIDTFSQLDYAKNLTKPSCRKAVQVAVFWANKLWKNDLKHLFNQKKDNWYELISRFKPSIMLIHKQLVETVKNKFINKNTDNKNPEYILEEDWKLSRYIKFCSGFLLSIYAVLMVDLFIGFIAFFYISQAITNSTCFKKDNKGYAVPIRENEYNDIEDIEFEEIKI